MEIKPAQTFLKKKFISLLLPGTMTMVVVTFLLLSDSIIAGIALGKDAVAAISLVAPAYSAASFFAGMISIGIPILFSKAMGEFDQKGAERWFSLGFTASIMTGCILFALLLSFGDRYLLFYEPDQTVFLLAKPYLFWYSWAILLSPLNMLMTEMVLTDGDETISFAANIAQMAGNLVLSIVLVFFWGIAGIGFASFAGTAISLAISCLHFFRPSSSFKPGIYFSFRGLAAAAKYSAIDASSYLFIGIFTVIINRFIVSTYGVEMLILVSFILFIKEFQLVFDGIGEAITPLMNIYLGEETYEGAKKCYALAQKTAVIEALFMLVLFVLLAPFIARIYGVTNSPAAAYAINGIRIMAFGFVPISLLYLVSSYYLLIDRIILGVAICGMRDALVAIPICIVCGKLFGLYGLFFGSTLSPLVAYIVTMLYVRLRYGKANWPLLLSEKETAVTSAFYEFTVTPENVIATQKQVEAFLSDAGVSKKIVFRCKHLIEDLYMLIYEKNGSGKQLISAECTVILRDNAVQIITKDDGVLFNLADEDANAVSCLAFVVSGYMDALKGNKKYLTTMSYNRNTFKVTG
ncbi:MAG: multidrug transporter MatE [Spirochaetia bacterium]|nr:multidrug transporter MatE [Spirochaetia bacterium]